MLRALSKGAKVTVVAVTEGAALFGRNGIPEGRETAAARKAEQVRALCRLGVSERSTFHLGFPDGGIAKLRHKHRTERSGAYFCPWLHSDRTGNESCVPGISFTSNKLLDVLESTLCGALCGATRRRSGASRRRSGASRRGSGDSLANTVRTHVFTHHHRDKHPDHRGVTWFVRKALMRLVKSDVLEEVPGIYEYLTYHPKMHWPPAGRSVPVSIARSLPYPGHVVNLRLTPHERQQKERALDCFVPILGTSYIDNWRRTNEVYWMT